MSDKNYISFFVNGKAYTVVDADPTVTFNSWIRMQPGLKGTKVMCSEGGCGCCVVALQRPSETIKAVNSCLLPLCSVDGCHVTTVEGVGSNQAGYSKIQSRLSAFGGSQCGYCTPGFVMSMHSLLEEDSSPSQQTIEDNFDGNICRCTGYRPILDAMKCFACDADPKLKETCKDIEDLIPAKCISKQGSTHLKARCFQVTYKSSTWIRPNAFNELALILRSTIDQKKDFKFICGNTGSGVFKSDKVFPLYIDISQVQEFVSIVESNDFINIGASVTLTQITYYLLDKSETSVTFVPIASHLKKVANKPVRNCASWAGNVMLKHHDNNFPSDVCVLLETVGAKIKVYDVASDAYTYHSVFGKDGFLKVNMKDKMITSVLMPKIKDDGNIKMKTFKVMPRSQNALAYVNAGFVASYDASCEKLEKLSLVFGGLSSDFSHAKETEDYLCGKTINSNHTLQDALNILSHEVQLHCGNHYKINLVQGLFYKFYLSLCNPNELASNVVSGMDSLVRPLSTGTQTFKCDPKYYPVSKNIPKFSGKVQASGEAYYISDRSPTTDELHCDVVMADVANADIDAIDFSTAQEMDGFVQIITRENFPSDVKNTFLYPLDNAQPIIALEHVSYAGQVVAIVIAETAIQAKRIAKTIKVTYKNKKKPILTIQDAIEENSFFDLNVPIAQVGNTGEAIATAEHVVSGEIALGFQYHFYMETQICRAECKEEKGFNIECATQGQRALQTALSHAFSVPIHKIDITTKRIGGAFGGKLANTQLIACIATLASRMTNRPVRFNASLKTCMSSIGSRMPYTMKYKLGFNDDGIAIGLDCSVYGNSGSSPADAEIDDVQFFKELADGAFYCPNRRYEIRIAKTNLPCSTWCRSPVTLQMTALSDLVIEHMASYLKKDPIQVKFANLNKNGQTDLLGNIVSHCTMRSVYSELLSKYKVMERQEAIRTFNAQHKWKKRGIAVTPVKCFIEPRTYELSFGVLLSIYADDGTIVISHGGVECGQGINIKAMQVAAYKLGIPLEMITVQSTTTITSPNSGDTAASQTSELVCKSVIGCCDILNSRIQPVRAVMGPHVTWKDLIKECDGQKIDLTVAHKAHPLNDSPYMLCGASAAEVEYDVLTGENQIIKVDTVFDCGISINPSIDIGQIEGAFLMGTGFWLSEQMVYDQQSGRLLTDGTWGYHPPTTKDIPIEWKIDLLKDAPNPYGVLRSKACSEPPVCMSICVALALKRAVEAARRDRGFDQYFPLPTPSLIDNLHNTCLLHPAKDFKLR